MNIDALKDKLSSIMGDTFGIVDGAGVHIFPSGRENVALPQNVAADSFAAESGRLFYFRKIDADGEVWFYDAVSSDDIHAVEVLKKSLKLCAAFYSEYYYAANAGKNEFFRSLLLGGRDSVSHDDFTEYSRNLQNGAGEFTVLLVSVASGRDSDSVSSNLANVCDFLEIVFPSAEGFVTVKVRNDLAAVIVPLADQDAFRDVMATASSLKKTISAELLTDIAVSVGARVKQLRFVDSSFKTAERALAIAESFGLSDDVFSYDKLGLTRIIYGQRREVCEAYLKEIFGSAFLDYYARKTSGDSRNPDSVNELIVTISTFLELNQNISETSKRLYVHRNTLGYRIEKFNRMTGLDCTKFEDGMKISIGFMIMKYLSSIQ
ncbi:MAG: helix-turn-helix domain-containing protein [Clostridia bacterium]|nr:helix-turn-helix domain-containing protein [Clostridia bacterium]